MGVPTSTSVLTVLTQARLGELARGLGVSIPSSGRKDVQIARLLDAARLPLPALLGHLYRDELRAACREHDLTAESRSRDELAGRLLDAAGLPRSRDTIPPLFATTTSGDTPKAGDVVMVRRRNYLVDRVHPPVNADDATRVALICLDDDNQGRRTEVLWELELGARVLSERDHGLGAADRLDPPRTFSAYYNALRWNMVTATDARLFQAPFRAGVELMNHQLTPLKRALELPRANMFIADGVGLGKTIEAGLVMQELLLRNQIDTVLIVAPASVCLQWQREMSTRFGQVDISALTIEHVMPQTLTEWWKVHLGDDWEEDHDQLLHTLGNLTLTNYNAELSNRSFPEKRVLLANSHVELNRYFDDVEHWNQGEIERRGRADRSRVDGVALLRACPRGGRRLTIGQRATADSGRDQHVAACRLVPRQPTPSPLLA